MRLHLIIIHHIKLGSERLSSSEDTEQNLDTLTDGQMDTVIPIYPTLNFIGGGGGILIK